MPLVQVEKTVWDWELMNDIKPIWTRPAKEVEEDEYKAFYKTFSKVCSLRPWLPSRDFFLAKASILVCSSESRLGSCETLCDNCWHEMGFMNTFDLSLSPLRTQTSPCPISTSLPRVRSPSSPSCLSPLPPPGACSTSTEPRRTTSSSCLSVESSSLMISMTWCPNTWTLSGEWWVTELLGLWRLGSIKEIENVSLRSELTE